MRKRAVVLLTLCVAVSCLGGMCSAPRAAQTPTSRVDVEAGSAEVTTETRSAETAVEGEVRGDVVRFGLDPGTLGLLEGLLDKSIEKLTDIGGSLVAVIVGAAIILAAAPSIFKKELYRIVSYGIGGAIIILALSKWLFF